MRTFSVLALFFALAAPLAAQDTTRASGGEELVDRVVAVVGDTVLLLSDVQEEMQQLQLAGRLPTDPVQREAVGREILQSRVNDLLLLEAAQQANIEVRQEEVDELVEQNLNSVRRQFRTEAEFNAALGQWGRSLAEYRRELAEQQRNQLLIQKFVAQRLGNRARPLVSEEQIRAAFEAQRANLGTRPATVSLQQVLVRTQPSDSAMAQARRTAEDVLRQLREGADFAVLARRFSQDPGSREHGGDLGWFKRGRMVREFENVAFSLRPGETSGIVETEFGLHIIRVEKARGPERQARHILITPETTPADVERARESADSVAEAVRGGAAVPALARQYGTPEAEIEVVRIPLDRLPPVYDEALAEAEPGAVLGPIELESPTGTRFAVVRVTDRLEAGPYTLDDLRERIQTRLQEQQMIEQLVEELRGQIHVAVLQ